MVASPKGLVPEKDCAGKGQQHIQRQTRPFFREGATQIRDRNCQRVINIWSRSPDGAWHQDLLTDRQTQCDFDFDFCCSYRIPCGGGVEYLHRNPASRRRRRKRKFRIWDSKICSRVPRDSDPRMTALYRARSNCKPQTRPLVREGAPNQQTRNCQTIIKIWS
jgi:hypothetical protein